MGSEMCIRDSPSNQQENNVHEDGRGGGNKSPPKGGTNDKDVLICTHFGSLKDTHCSELMI